MGKTEERLTVEEILRMREEYMITLAGGVTPFVWKKGDGAILEMWDGKKFIDGAVPHFGIGVVGHGNKAVIEAVKRQADQIMQSGLENTTLILVELAKRLAEVNPYGLKKSIFFNSGAEAIENAVKIAKRHTKRHEIIALDTAFHGRTALCMTLSAGTTAYQHGYAIDKLNKVWDLSPYIQGIHHILGPTCNSWQYWPNHCGFGLKYPDCNLACARELECTIRYRSCQDNVAAVIITGGASFSNWYPPEYMSIVKKICKENGVLLIIDETHQMYGSGKLFALDNWNPTVDPDIMVLSDGLGSGLPLSVVMASEEVANSVEDGDIHSSHGGCAVACAGALAALNFAIDNKLPERALELEKKFRKKYKELSEEAKIVTGVVHGRGVRAKAELVRDRKTREPLIAVSAQLGKQSDKDIAVIISKKLHERGVIGEIGHARPPLVITDEQYDTLLEAHAEVVKEVDKLVRSGKLF